MMSDGTQVEAGQKGAIVGVGCSDFRPTDKISLQFMIQNPIVSLLCFHTVSERIGLRPPFAGSLGLDLS